MRSRSAKSHLSAHLGGLCTLACACLCSSLLFAAQESGAKSVAPASAASSAGARLFDSPQQAADTLIDAAEKFDVAAITRIFGPDGDDIVLSGEFAQDRKHAADF